MPDTRPEEETTVAAAGLPLPQVPPASPLLVSWVLKPEQTVVVPLIAPALGTVLTVTTVVAVFVQRRVGLESVPAKVVTVYVMVAVPPAMPETKPEVAFTVATEVLLLLHVLMVLGAVVPLLLSWVVVPAQSVVVPLIVPALGASKITTVVRAELIQPLSVTR